MNSNGGWVVWVWALGSNLLAGENAARGILFVSSVQERNAEIFLVREDGSGQRKLAGHPAEETDPAWSPDGKRIAFISTRHAKDPLAIYRELYVMDADGANVRRLTQNEAQEGMPAWSADGTKICFVSNVDPRNPRLTRSSDLWVCDADGKNPKPLVAWDSLEGSPAWSPDGTRIAFMSDRGGNQDLWIISADGTGPKNLTEKSPALDSSPAWSPDGKTLAFRSDRTCNGDIYLMDADGSNVRRLTFNNRTDDFPCWSPSGHRIAFLGHRERDAQPGIYTVNADGSHMRRLTEHSVWRPSWSPVGPDAPFVPDLPALKEGMLFVSRRDHRSTDLYVVDKDGSNLWNLTDTEDVSIIERYPHWSPDRKKIVFQSNREAANVCKLYGMNANGTGIRKLTQGDAYDTHPAWSPDGTKIAFLSGRTEKGKMALYLIDPDGKNPRKLSDNLQPAAEDFPISWSPDATKIAWVGLAQAGGPGAGGGHFLFTANASGNPDPVRLMREGVTNIDPAWSPDGTRVAFVTNRGPAGYNFTDIYVCDADGGNPRKLTDKLIARSPAWSPEGTEIAFAGGNDLYVMKADGANLRQVTRDGLSNEFPHWTSKGFGTLVSGAQVVVYTAAFDGNGRKFVQGLAKDSTPTQARRLRVVVPKGDAKVFQEAADAGGIAVEEAGEKDFYAVIEKHKLGGFPAILFVDPKGSVLEAKVGAMEVKALWERSAQLGQGRK